MNSAGLSVSLHQAGPIPLAIDLSCAPGEMLALVGPSGSGKSTTLRSIAGLYRPRTGKVSVGGEVWFDSETGLALPPHLRRSGMVFQNYALFPHMTALRNVMSALDHLPKAERKARAETLLDQVHLNGLGARRPAELSGGQQQRVAVARALARDPKVLLLDEPFSAVDRVTRRKLHQEIAELRKQLSTPTILVTHDIDEAVGLADTMVVLHHGRILQSAEPRAIMENPATPEVAEVLGLDP
ncbi:MAG: ABC transporter ATP-binding protein [Pseudomonadota bacterium]